MKRAIGAVSGVAVLIGAVTIYMGHFADAVDSIARFVGHFVPSSEAAAPAKVADAPAETPRDAASAVSAAPPAVHQEMHNSPHGVQVAGDLNLLDETPPTLAVRSAEMVPQGDGSRKVRVYFKRSKRGDLGLVEASARVVSETGELLACELEGSPVAVGIPIFSLRLIVTRFPLDPDAMPAPCEPSARSIALVAR